MLEVIFWIVISILCIIGTVSHELWGIFFVCTSFSCFFQSSSEGDTQKKLSQQDCCNLQCNGQVQTASHLYLEHKFHLLVKVHDCRMVLWLSHTSRHLQLLSSSCCCCAGFAARWCSREEVSGTVKHQEQDKDLYCC